MEYYYPCWSFCYAILFLPSTQKTGTVVHVLIGCLFLAAPVFYSAPTNEPQTEVRSQPEQTDFLFPARLKIPSINVDAAVEYVGLTPNGAMDVPKNQEDVAWYEFGQRPGEKGSAVIAGHYGRWKTGSGSVFDDVHKLRKGDKLYIEDEKGATITFVVRESRRYDPEANASDVFTSHDGKAHLNLITCEGVWNEIENSYSHRLVVFADQEIESGQ